MLASKLVSQKILYIKAATLITIFPTKESNEGATESVVVVIDNWWEKVRDKSD
jgi:hypothetical protein